MNEKNQRALKSKKKHQQTLPKKRISAGCLLFDDEGRLLIVQPTYKSTWEIPGGVVENRESPRAAAAREMWEELGLTLEPVRLLGIDYGKETKSRTERLQFIFLGPVIAAEQKKAIELPLLELSEYRFLPPDEALALLNRKLAQRVQICLENMENHTPVYLENQTVIFPKDNPQ